jgi:putative protease
MTQTELLAPAKDLTCGIAAIDAGADAVYVGAARFGARSRAGNTVADIEALARHAHRYWARVYVTINTLLHDHEVAHAVRLAHEVHEAGADALIIQDVGLLECDLPPLPLIASTQMHNNTPERVAFLERAGFRRAILARELSIGQIQEIRARTTIELEAFIHGALCVCYSGQCYMSYAVGGRSGNRGECAQPCRRRYTLVDRDGQAVVQDRHLLSLCDLSLSGHLDELLDAGVTSFKIEGRLKDRAYVVNVVSHYRRELDALLAARGMARSSSGSSTLDVQPDLSKTFNRGYTTLFLHGRHERVGATDTPKMVGERVGRIRAVEQRTLEIDGDVELHNGDGLCFYDQAGVLQGTVVIGVQGKRVQVADTAGAQVGADIHRNHDHDYLRQLAQSQPERKIDVRLTLEETEDGFRLTATDEDGNTASADLTGEKVSARKPDAMRATVDRQLGRTGGTVFRASEVTVDWHEPRFLRVSQLNQLRRDVLAQLTTVRERRRPHAHARIEPNDTPYPSTRLSFRGNVLNERAEAFYRRHGVTDIEPAPESGLDMAERPVMRTRYCLMHQLGFCDGASRRGHLTRSDAPREPLYLVDADGHRYRLRFDCAACEMEVLF